MEEMFREIIQKTLSEGKRNFVIFPFGEQGKRFKKLLNHEFGIEEILIIDNGSHDKNDHIKSLHHVEPRFLIDSTIFLVSDNFRIYLELRKQILQYVPKENIVDVFDGDRKTIDMLSDCCGGNTIRVFFNPILNLRKERSVEALGHNTGNLVFVDAVKEQVKYDYEARLTREWTRERLGRKNVISIMPAANFLQRGTRWCGDYIPILEDTDIRLTFVGLGAQANFHETPKDVVSKLSEEQKLYFRLVSEHAIQIGVRGEFTAECLKEIGITNVEVIGCPSFYQYAGGYSKLVKARADTILYTADRSKRKIYELARTSNCQLICQNYEDAEDPTIFFTASEWNSYICDSQFSFAFGSRFHGNMMALRNGVPTLWIVHDWRTLELVRYLGLPYLDYYSDKFQRIKYVEELLEYCDYSEVYKRYPKLHERYCDFMRKNFDEEFRK